MADWSIEYTYDVRPAPLTKALKNDRKLCLTWRDGGRVVTYPLSKRELRIYTALRDSSVYGLTAFEISQEAKVNYNTTRRVLGMWSDMGVLVPHKVSGYKDSKTKLNCYVLSSKKEHVEKLVNQEMTSNGVIPTSATEFFIKEFIKRRKFIDKCSPRLHRWSDMYLPFYGD